MKKITIYSHRTKTPLFSGRFKTLKACLEQAIKENVNLSYANLKNGNLSNAHLDNAQLSFADFRNTNLSGANLSESMLTDACFDNASLYNTCLAYSHLQGASFEYSQFGATNITQSDISQSYFAGLSCFSLEFVQTQKMDECHYNNPCGTTISFSSPPIVITGTNPLPTIFIGEYIKTGNTMQTIKEPPNFLEPLDIREKNILKYLLTNTHGICHKQEKQ